MNSLKTLGLCGVIFLPLLVLSCGTDKLREAFMLGKKIGASKNQLSASSKEDLLDSSEGHIERKKTKKNEEPQNISDLPKNNLSSNIINPYQPFIGSLPYYCNPLQYPAHIINAAAACKPYLQHIYQGQRVNWTDIYDHNSYRPSYDPGFKNDDDYPNLSRNDDDQDGRHYRYLHRIYERQKHRGSRRHNHQDNNDNSSSPTDYR